MILFFNVRITSEPSIHFVQKRGNLPNFTSYDIFKYSLSSYAPMNHLWSRVIFYIKLDNEFSGREEELAQWIKQHFPEDKLSINWYRNNSVQDFRNATKELDLINDDLIWFQGNHDHPFIDSDLLTVESAVTHLQEDPDPMATFWYSHWPEWLLISTQQNGQLTSDRRLVKYMHGGNHSMKLIKRLHWDWYWKQDRPGLIFRFDCFKADSPPASSSYISVKETCRHFDGYSHVQIGLDLVPPLSIPPRFFEGDMTVRYGFDDRDESCVNINPCSTTLYGVDKTCADYKLGLDEIPLFWKTRIKQILVNPHADQNLLISSRNRNIIARTTEVVIHGYQKNTMPTEYFDWQFK
jgi:hypothetical protein